jgi:hypothetical protein
VAALHGDAGVEQRESLRYQALDGVESRELARFTLPKAAQRIQCYANICVRSAVHIEEDFLPTKEEGPLPRFGVDRTRQQFIRTLDYRVTPVNLANIRDHAISLLVGKCAHQQNQNRWYER